MQKSRFWVKIWLHRVLWTPSVIHPAATDHGELITLVAGKRRCLLLAGNDDEVYGKKPRRYAEDNRTAFNCTQWYIWSLSNKNKRLRSRYYTVDANYWRTQSIARPLCNSRATCLFIGLSIYRTFNDLVALRVVASQCIYRMHSVKQTCGLIVRSVGVNAEWGVGHSAQSPSPSI